MSNLEDCIVEESILNAEIRNFVFYVLRLKFTLDIQMERLSNQLDLDQVQAKLHLLEVPRENPFLTFSSF